MRCKRHDTVRKRNRERIGKDIVIEPFNKKQLNPNSYNLRLHNELLVYEDDILDMKKENKARKIIIPEEALFGTEQTVFGKNCRVYKDKQPGTNA